MMSRPHARAAVRRDHQGAHNSAMPSAFILMTMVSTVVASHGSLRSTGRSLEACSMSAEVHFTYGHPVSGRIRFTQAGPESPVQYTVDVQDLPADILPSPYHVHTKAVLDGDCYTTGGHLNYNKDVDPKQTARYRCECSGATPAGCENGDLASKHGNITSPSFREGSYTDGDITLYGDESIIGRSVVIHDYMNNRYTCGDIVQG